MKPPNNSDNHKDRRSRLANAINNSACISALKGYVLFRACRGKGIYWLRDPWSTEAGVMAGLGYKQVIIGYHHVPW